MTYTYSELAALMSSITATSNDAIVEQAYAIVAGREADASGKAYWVARLEDDLTPETLIAAMIRGAEAYKENNPGEDDYDIDTIALKEQVAIELGDAGVSADDIASALMGVTDIASANAAIQAATGSGETGEDGETSFDGIIAQATGGVTQGTEGNDTIYMSASQDFVFAGAGNDTIVARGNGSFDNADVIDGGAGDADTIEVMLDNGETAESPLVTNVEILKVQAQATTTDSGDNDVDGLGTVESNIDAGDMSSVEQYWSEDSRADLAIEDISRNSHITTIGMRETDPNVNYKVYFDPENITAPGATESGATLLVKMANVLQVAEGGNPIENFTQFSFSVDTTNVVVDVSEATDYDDVVDAIELAAAEAGLDVTVEKQTATNAYFSIDIEDYTAGELAGTYNPILITNNGAGTLVKGSFTTAEDATDAAYTNSMATGAAASTPALTQVDVIFDRVGKNSQGGDFVAGSDSTGVSGSAGIQQFNIDVDRDSWLTSIASTNDTLEVVNVENIEVNSDGNGSLTVDAINNIRVFDGSTMTGDADITINLDDSVTTKYLNLQDDGTDSSADNSENNWLDVVDREFSYDFGSGDDTLDLTIDGGNLEEAGTATREDFVLEVRAGNGDDTIDVTIAGGAFDSAAAYANSKENANLEIDAGAGDDTITTTGEGDWIISAGADDDTVYSDNSGAKADWAVNAGALVAVAAQAQVDTITMSGTDTATDGTGETLTITITDATGVAVYDVTYADDDNATTTAPASVVLNGGSTTSTLTYTIGGAVNAITITANTAGEAFSTAIANDSADGADEISGSVATTTPNIVASAGTTTADLDSDGRGTEAVLYKAQLTVTYSGALGVNAEAAVATDEGFESTVTIGTSNYVGDQTNVNQAIKDAINNDDVLNKLLVVNDGPANTLVITSLVDGLHASNDIEITITAPTLTNLTAAEQEGMQTAYEVLQADSTATLTQGILDAYATAKETASAPEIDDTGAAAANRGSDNTINLGNGDDVLVLSTDADSAETIVFTGSNIGNNTIVNFTLADDILDFTAYLPDIEDIPASGSDESQTRIATTLTTDGAAGIDATSNEVIVINDFAQDLHAAGTADDETWALLDAADLLAALIDVDSDGASIYGNLDEGTVSEDVDLVGTTQKNIVMVENDLNDGEYKVFEVTSSTDTDEFTAATYLGTVDFGDTIDNTTVVA